MKTPLYEKHCRLGAKIVDFCGWEMPVQYQGIIPEHHAVRQKVGIFDVSHMGRIDVSGPEAEKFLDYLSTNVIAGKPDLTATYTVWCNEQGGCVDDVIVYKQDPEHFFIIVNAGNRQKDLDHVLKYAKPFRVTIQERYADNGILAIQGPRSVEVVSYHFEEAKTLKHMHFANVTYKNTPLILSATGYTGAPGFEIYASNSLITELWDTFIQRGAVPVGLGARDTLRMEMGYALYGHELEEDIKATETVSAWTVKQAKSDFLGKAALQALQNKRVEFGIELLEPGIARSGYEVFQENELIGRITSGTFSPTLNKAIAIVLGKRKLQEGETVEVQIRQNRIKACVVPLPFLKENRV